MRAVACQPERGHRVGRPSDALQCPGHTCLIVVRSYRPGDDTRVVALWNASYASYAGLATRTVEYWRWSILSRPGMNADDVLLLEIDGQVLGYAALWTGGTVLEFAVDPAQRSRTRRAMADRLVSALEQKARARGDDGIQFMLPASDRLIDRALRAAAYLVEPGPCFMVRLLNPQALLLQLLRQGRAELAAFDGKTVLFKLTPGDDPFLLQSRLLVRIGESIEVQNVSDASDCPADCTVQLTIGALAELIFCGAEPHGRRGNSLMTVDPPSRDADGRALLKALAIESRWFTPLSDTF